MRLAWLRDWTPPALRRLVRRPSIRFTGDYASWEEARSDSAGYDDEAIFERVLAAAREVRDGRAAFERDGVTFPEPEPRWPLLAALFRSAALAGGPLAVVDVGGSLGSTWFQCRPFLAGLESIRWSVVEQPRFVELGRAEFESDTLRFHESIEDATATAGTRLALLSGVLPYVADPHAVLDDVLRARFEAVVIDRTAFLEGDADRLTVQSVPASIYGRPIRYPAWFLSRTRALDRLGERYRLLAGFDALDGVALLDRKRIPVRGMVLERAPADLARSLET